MREDYLDEKIIRMINQVEIPAVMPDSASAITEELPPEERTIYTGIKIDGQWIEFEERTFVDGKLSMRVPKAFVDMDLETAKIKYPMERRPHTILTDYTGTVNILFVHMDTPTSNEDIATIRDGLFHLMRRVNPGIKALSMGEEIISNKVAYVEFTNSAIDGKLYNLMFYVDLEGAPLMGSINCRTKSMRYWQRPAFEMMRSIKILVAKGD